MRGQKYVVLKMSYNEILARSNRDIMKMANKGFFLPGKGPENYKDDVDKNNDLLLENIKKENDEKKQQFNEEKGFFSQLYDDIVTGHVFTDFSNAGKSVTKGISYIADTPRYIMYALGLIVLIMLLKK